MRILFCFDGSESALAALPVARQLAAAAEAEVHIVRVTTHDLTTGGVAWSGSSAVDIAKHQRAEEEDARYRAELQVLAGSFPSVPVIAILNAERVASELVRYARANEFDLIVVGCRQRGAFHPGLGGELTRQLAESHVAPLVLGPLVPAAHLDLASVPRGCAVFSRDGFYLGDVASHDATRLLIRREGGSEVAVLASDASDLSVASGLHLAFDRVDLEGHLLTPAQP